MRVSMAGKEEMVHMEWCPENARIGRVNGLLAVDGRDAAHSTNESLRPNQFTLIRSAPSLFSMNNISKISTARRSSSEVCCFGAIQVQRRTAGDTVGLA